MIEIRFQQNQYSNHIKNVAFIHIKLSAFKNQQIPRLEQLHRSNQNSTWRTKQQVN